MSRIDLSNCKFSKAKDLGTSDYIGNVTYQGEVIGKIKWARHPFVKCVLVLIGIDVNEQFLQNGIGTMMLNQMKEEEDYDPTTEFIICTFAPDERRISRKGLVSFYEKNDVLMGGDIDIMSIHDLNRFR